MGQKTSLLHNATKIKYYTIYYTVHFYQYKSLIYKGISET